jgi:type VI secretion system secreted protein Hcp
MSMADFFLKINGIEGECEDSKHKNELQIESWSWGEVNSGSSGIGSGAGTGKVSMNDFHFVVQTSKASPNLALAVADGRHIDECKLTCRKSTGEGGQTAYMVITFSDVVISSYQVSASNSMPLPMESISFNYTKIKIEYSPQDSKGVVGKTVTMTWDLKQNKKG